MTTIAINLRDKLTSAVGHDRVHQDVAPQNFAGGYVWFGFAGGDQEDLLSGPADEVPFRLFYDCECIDDTPEGAEEMAFAIGRLHFTAGAFGTATVQGVFVAPQPADYVPRGDNSDSGKHVSAHRIEIVGYEG